MNEGLLEKAAKVKKLLVFLAFCAGEALNEGVVPERWEGYVRSALAIATAYGIFKVKNAPWSAEVARQDYSQFADPPGEHSEDRLPDQP